MDWLQENVNLPRRLSARLWLITLPSAIVSFERRTKTPRLPKAARALGLLAGGAGVALGFMALRSPDTRIAYDGPMANLGRSPAIAGGLLGLAGAAFITRSTFLLLYTLGLAAVAGSERMEIEEPTSATLLGTD
ncbi:MAG TPA: hypothetical protein VMR52_04945 [Dehalococcoidia bacterium]|nr:hypothetical protein [Dehalococcoidia bacterium]